MTTPAMDELTWTPLMVELLVETYLPTDRQWPRHLRIAHAQYQMHQLPKGSLGQAFWKEIIKRNDT